MNPRLRQGKMREGYDAAYSGSARSTNPYAATSRQFSAWDAGWVLGNADKTALRPAKPAK
jgi:ribosome modulation factor